MTKKVNEQDTKTFSECYVGTNGKRNQQKLHIQVCGHNRIKGAKAKGAHVVHPSGNRVLDLLDASKVPSLDHSLGGLMQDHCEVHVHNVHVAAISKYSLTDPPASFEAMASCS